MHPIHVGTRGWSYEDWKDVVYTKGAKPRRLARDSLPKRVGPSLYGLPRPVC
jgi:hypothetical protein